LFELKALSPYKYVFLGVGGKIIEIFFVFFNLRNLLLQFASEILYHVSDNNQCRAGKFKRLMPWSGTNDSLLSRRCTVPTTEYKVAI